MKTLQLTRAALIMVMGAWLVTSCSFDPNARKQKYYQSAQEYVQKHQYREAAIQFTNAIKIDPSFAEAHFQLAQTYMSLQQFDRARLEYQRTVELRPDDYRARLALTQVLILFRDFKGAQEQTDYVVGRRPFDPGVHAAIASLMVAENNISGAIAETQQAISLEPKRWELYVSLGLLQLKDNQPAQAEASFQKVIELNPTAVQARVLLGNFYISQKKWGEAEGQFQYAISHNPGSIEPRTGLAQLYLAQGRRSDAERVLQQAKHDLPQEPESFLALSKFYFMSGDLGRSIDEQYGLLKERPGDVKFKKQLVELLIQAARYDEARGLVDQMLKANAKDGDALVYRSEMQISNGDVSAAAQVLQAVVQDDPRNAQAHYALGVALEKQGELGHAASEWRAALQLSPDMLPAHQALASAAIRLDDMRTLYEEAGHLIRLQPGSPTGYGLRGLASLNRKHYSDAEADMRQAIAIDPQSSFGYVQMGNLRMAQARFSEAAAFYQSALDRNTASVDALRGLISTYIAQKQVDKAIAVAHAQIAKSPNNSKFYGLLGGVLAYRNRDLSGAETAFAKAVELDEHNTDATLQLCQIRAVRGDVDRAIATGEDFLQKNPRQENLLVLMGNLYSSKGVWKSAENAYHKALAMNSQNPVASNGLARTMLRTGGNPDVALVLAQTARKGLPESAGIADTLGWIYYQKGVYPMAISFLQEALSLQQKVKTPENPDIHYHLGMAYARTQQPALAREQLERVLKINPRYSEADAIKLELSRLKS